MKKKGKRYVKILTAKVTVVLVMVLFVSVIGATYAYFYASDYNGSAIGGNMATVNLNFSVN